jgi:hypothetical protein
MAAKVRYLWCSLNKALELAIRLQLYAVASLNFLPGTRGQRLEGHSHDCMLRWIDKGPNHVYSYQNSYYHGLSF